MARIDPHSYFDDAQPVVRRLTLALRVDFARRTLAGTAQLAFDAPAAGPLDLDAKGLAIARITTQDGAAVPFALGEPDAILGARLRLDLPAGTSAVTLEYATSPDAVALQWLDPSQTKGGAHPFMFSQCQSIHARTIVPLQDSPRVRVAYSAALDVPEGLTAVMSAGSAGDRPAPEPGRRIFLFEMPQSIPSYLIALAVGHLAARELGPRSRVWAEPETVDAAAHEFGAIEGMIDACERLFGPYEWDRYDMLVLPPSFPYGGMENPRLTFLTPTLLAGDRSLVDVVVHELAHSWTGNLVTNATMDHFWLNEGFTVWAERRILEALHGEAAAALSWAINEKGLVAALERLGAGSPLTKLRTDLTGIDPDDAYSQVPYEKGARLVVLLERAVGRPRFEAFIREYIARFRFTSITTEEFLAFLEERLPGVAAQVDAAAWLHAPGLPANTPVFRSEALEALEGLARGFATGQRPAPGEAARWSSAEMLVYMQNLPRILSEAECRELDAAYGLNARGNYEILVEWLTIAAGSGYAPALPRVREVLTTVGRMKYLRPLFLALGKTAAGRAEARAIHAEAKERWHALSRRVVESVMDGYPAA